MLSVTNPWLPQKEHLMKFVGVDLHQQTITLVVVDAARTRLARKRFSNLQSEAIAKFLRAWGPFQLTVEATASYEWFVQLVEPFAQRIVLAHPGKLRIIAESTRKSDNLDALTLAEMLALDQIPAAYRPTPRQREHRTLVRHRQFLQRRITSLRNKIRRILSHSNRDRKDLFTEVGREYLAALALSGADRFCVDQLTTQWEQLVEQLRDADRALKDFAQIGSAQEQQDRALLLTIPGVGLVTTDVILAELADPRRFSSLKEVAAYAGLVPGQRESAGKRKALHIEKTGSALLRWALVQAAWQLVKRSLKWRSVFETLSGRIGKKKAIIAVARRLLTVAYSLLKQQQPYRELPISTTVGGADQNEPDQPARKRSRSSGRGTVK
jgi:transposase